MADQYKLDDIVEVDINSCEGLEPKWVPGIVTADTAANGRTMVTVNDGIYVGLFSRDGWDPSELRLGTTIRGWEYTYGADGRMVVSAKPIRVGDAAEDPPETWLQRLRRRFIGGQANG